MGRLMCEQQPGMIPALAWIDQYLPRAPRSPLRLLLDKSLQTQMWGRKKSKALSVYYSHGARTRSDVCVTSSIADIQTVSHNKQATAVPQKGAGATGQAKAGILLAGRQPAWQCTIALQPTHPPSLSPLDGSNPLQMPAPAAYMYARLLKPLPQVSGREQLKKLLPRSNSRRLGRAVVPKVLGRQPVSLLSVSHSRVRLVKASGLAQVGGKDPFRWLFLKSLQQRRRARTSQAWFAGVQD